VSCLVFIVLALAAAAPALAQNRPPQTAQPPQARETQFLSRFDFQVGMEHLFSEDPRFVWDANFGGEIDFVDYGRGRATFTAVYQTILGSEFRAFDPNQGNYMLEASLSARTREAEIAGVFHHISRHLSDRPKRHPVDWNMIGGRIRRSVIDGRNELHTRVDVRGAIQKSFVDYRWELDGEVRGQVGVAPRAAVTAGGGLLVVGVDGSRARGAQYGWRGEGGIRLEGPRAAVELFAAAERRIDPYQLEFSTATWLTLGFRLASR
jgi:hypothetical protein